MPHKLPKFTSLARNFNHSDSSEAKLRKECRSPVLFGCYQLSKLALSASEISVQYTAPIFQPSRANTTRLTDDAHG